MLEHVPCGGAREDWGDAGRSRGQPLTVTSGFGANAGAETYVLGFMKSIHADATYYSVELF